MSCSTHSCFFHKRCYRILRQFHSKTIQRHFDHSSAAENRQSKKQPTLFLFRVLFNTSKATIFQKINGLFKKILMIYFRNVCVCCKLFLMIQKTLSDIQLAVLLDLMREKKYFSLHIKENKLKQFQQIQSKLNYLANTCIRLMFDFIIFLWMFFSQHQDLGIRIVMVKQVNPVYFYFSLIKINFMEKVFWNQSFLIFNFHLFSKIFVAV